jgi:hypothetical protein
VGRYGEEEYDDLTAFLNMRTMPKTIHEGMAGAGAYGLGGTDYDFVQETARQVQDAFIRQTSAPGLEQVQQQQPRPAAQPQSGLAVGSVETLPNELDDAYNRVLEALSEVNTGSELGSED